MRKEISSVKAVGSDSLEQDLSRVDQSLDVMERHADECRDIELAVQDDMRKRDREYKDEHLHSVPRARKHNR